MSVWLFHIAVNIGDATPITRSDPGQVGRDCRLAGSAFAAGDSYLHRISLGLLLGRNRRQSVRRGPRDHLGTPCRSRRVRILPFFWISRATIASAPSTLIFEPVTST